MSRPLFYLKYAARNLRRNLRWTLFAIFCIGAGVATIVALRSLGLAISDSLTDSARSSNRGDITISTSGFGGGFGNFGGGARGSDTISPRIVNAIQARTEELGGQVTAYSIVGNVQVTAVDANTIGRPQFASTLLIDPKTYPPTGQILAEEPAGVPLQDLFDGYSVVVSRNLADAQGIEVGDSVRVTGTDQMFTVTGIVATEEEAGLRNLFASFFGFAYLSRDVAETLQLSEDPNAVSLVLPPGTPAEDIERLAEEFESVTRSSVISTVNDVLRQNTLVADAIGRFIVVMGLGALLIGGVGIINTMLVMVGRRSMEIAALKTFGLKGNQVSMLFLAEAFLLGLLGSIVGCIAGMLLSGAVNAYGEAFLQQRLTWRLYPEALLYGIGLGMVVTMVFGLLPVLTANRVRPASILRPNEAQIPGASLFHALLVLTLVVLIVGGIAGQIIGNVWVGIIGVALTLLLMSVIVGQLWLIVWVIGRLPAFGSVDLKLALRNLTARRLRTATTLMALSGGMFALSFITYIGAGTREILNIQLEQSFGGNVIVLPLSDFIMRQSGGSALNAELDNIEGITYRSQVFTYATSLVAVNGQPPQLDLAIPGVFLDNIPEEAREEIQREMRELTIQVQMRETDNPNPLGQIVAGRALTPEDRGRQVLVAPDTDVTRQIGITVGSIVTLEEDGRRRDFEVVGLTTASNQGFDTGAYFAPMGAFNVGEDFSYFVLQVEPERLNAVLLELTENPFNFALDVSFLDGLIGRFIDQFSAIPTVVGLLSLLAAAVTMANTVSLATLERRRQIGILKAVGLKSNRVLGVMLIENTVIGLLGGLLGIGLSAAAVAILTQLGTGTPIPIPSDARLVTYVLIGASLIIAWIATLLSAAPAAGERVTSVLRYE